MTTEISLIGPLAVRADSVVVPIRGDITRAVVARLALDAGAVVATDDLVAAVWSEEPPAALSSLRSHISRLRSDGFPVSIHGDRRGYQIAIDAAQTDLGRFRAAVAEAAAPGCDEPDAVELLESAVALARLPLLDGLDAFPFVPPARERFTEERRTAVEALADLRLGRGEHALVIDLLADLVERHPDHERPTRTLAVALARSGRTTEALDAIDALAAHLREEQGLDLPGRLVELRTAIVRQDPAVIAPSAGLVRPVIRTGVPIPLTRCIGRSAERAEVVEARAASRLVTIVGGAGMGKTRLAVEVARQSTSAVDDEQWMVDLTTASGPEEVTTVVADLVGATSRSTEAIAARLGGRRALLVLDNAEHVLGAVSVLVLALIEAAPQLGILVTSREALRVPGERVVLVEPLAGAAEADAVQLFTERAEDASVLFVSGDESVGRVCRALDGIPLALELAASRLDVLSLAELEESVHEIVGGSGSAGRHSSLAGAIAWSAALLDDRQRRLLAELGRFAGPFTADAVDRVCSGPGARDTLLELVQKSLVAQAGSESGTRRYRLLESVRAYLRSLPASATPASATPTSAMPASSTQDGEEWASRHLAFHVDLVETLAPRLRTSDARSARAALEGSWADLMLALATATERRDRASALRLTGGLAHYWFLKGMLVDGRAELERALALPGDADAGLEAAAYMGVALLAFQTGDAPAAFDYIARTEAAAHRAADTGLEAIALGQIVYGRTLFGDTEHAIQRMEAAAELAESAPAWVRGEVAMYEGQMLRGLGRPVEALVALGRSHRLASEVGYEWMRSSAAYVAGKVLVESRRAREAVSVLREGAVGAFAEDDPTSGLALVHTLAGACAFIERHEEGAMLFGAVDELGARYAYNPVRAEGEDARAHRDRVALGLTGDEFERAYRAGRRMDVPAVVALLGALPASPFVWPTASERSRDGRAAARV